MYTNNLDAALWERKMLEKQGWSRERVALIKILITQDRKRRACQIELKLSADISKKIAKL